MKHNTNGCGGKGHWFKPPYSIMFKACCNKHDELYNKGGNFIDRKIADIYLLEYIKLDIKDLNWYKVPYFYIWAYIYYFGVRIFGKRFFNFKV